MDEMQSPVFLEFATHLQVIKNRSANTVAMYLSDLALLFRYLDCTARGKDPADATAMAEADLSALTVADLSRVTTIQIYQFLNYCSKVRGNSPRALARKLSSLRTFFRFWAGNRRAIADDPTRNIDSPTVQKSLPKYLTFEESRHLLEVVLADTESETRPRDFAILVLFLNCGMRLSELCGINMDDIDPELRSLRVLGKGRKERIIYLNDACRDALTKYLAWRGADIMAGREPALFLSGRHQRISNKTVQWMVYKYLRAAGYGNRKLSTHKLRHTAATLMYQTGEVDVLMLKEILGHESIGTTQIYTHVSNEGMAQAMTKNPLANLTDGDISERVREERALYDGLVRHRTSAPTPPTDDIAEPPPVFAAVESDETADVEVEAEVTPLPDAVQSETEPALDLPVADAADTTPDAAIVATEDAPPAVTDAEAAAQMEEALLAAFEMDAEEFWVPDTPPAQTPPPPVGSVDLARLQDVLASLRKQYGVDDTDDI